MKEQPDVTESHKTTPSMAWIAERLEDYNACRSHREIAAIVAMFDQWAVGDPTRFLGWQAAAELSRAMKKHAPMHSLHEGYAVILEELDELWDEVRAWQPGSDLAKARKEAIQVAAMALRLVHDVCDQRAR